MKEKPTISVYILGQRCEVPAALTILQAFEWAGFQPVRGVGCRAGFCGACGTVYRLLDDHVLHYALACQTSVLPNMLLAQIPFFPTRRASYHLDELAKTGDTVLGLYPELIRCYGCNTCTKACPQSLDVLGYISAALEGDLGRVAALSFDCIHCGLCVARCPAELDPPNVALLARRLYGRSLAPKTAHLHERVEAIRAGDFRKEVDELKTLPLESLKIRYESRQIEP